MKILKKITVKTVLGRKVDGFDIADKLGMQKSIMVVWGRADKAEPGTNTLPNGDTSEYVKFRGEFKAHEGAPGKDSGEEVFSTTLIMPDVATGLLAGILNRENTTSVNFSFLIGIQKSDTPVGYEYYAAPGFDMAEESDPLDQIYQQAVKALPKPRARPAAVPAAKADKTASAPAGK